MPKLSSSTVRNFRILVGLLAPLGLAGVAAAQKRDIPAPYASIGSNAVTYRGPGRDSSYDLAGTTIRIGVLAPLHGPRKADGDAMVAAAQQALQETSRNPLPGGRRVALAIGDESVPRWGPLGNVLIHLVLDDQVIALISPASGETTHLSEQIGNRIGVPVLTLSEDATTTQIALPWIFRLGPSDALQAQIFAEDIYRKRGLRRVLLVTERDHDGRMGGEEFQKAARNLNAPPPAPFTIDPLQPEAESLPALVKVRSPQAIVFWTRPETAKKLLERIREPESHMPIYLTQQAAQKGFEPESTTSSAPGPETAGIWTVGIPATAAPGRESFTRRYELRVGKGPSPAAAEAYDAVCLVVDALHVAGANRARVRDQLATVAGFPGVSGIISFDNQGNNRATPRLVRLQ